jgi:hypothetical protein
MWYPVHMGVWEVIALALIASAASAAIVGWFLLRAPVGYEDEDGFHYGTPPSEEPGSPEYADLEDDSNDGDPEQA